MVVKLFWIGSCWAVKFGSSVAYFDNYKDAYFVKKYADDFDESFFWQWAVACTKHYRNHLRYA